MTPSFKSPPVRSRGPRLIQVWSSGYNSFLRNKHLNTNLRLSCASKSLSVFPGLEATHQSITLMPLESGHDLDLPRGLDAGIPGRKLTQIQQMTKACLHGHQGSEWLEWCSGKGF